MKPCPECNGDGKIKIDYNNPTKWDFSFDNIQTLWCPTCEGTGEIPDEPVSHCQACGEPILPGEKWCNFHKAAAELESDRHE